MSRHGFETAKVDKNNCLCKKIFTFVGNCGVMKKSLYKGAYRMVSVLSDITGGATPVTRWKVALGVAVLGLSAGAMTGCKPVVTCYDPVIPPGEEETDAGRSTGQNPETEGENDPGVMCYDPAMPPEEGQPD
jgi:hypothetical protein